MWGTGGSSDCSFSSCGLVELSAKLTEPMIQRGKHVVLVVFSLPLFEPALSTLNDRQRALIVEAVRIGGQSSHERLLR